MHFPSGPTARLMSSVSLVVDATCAAVPYAIDPRKMTRSPLGNSCSIGGASCS
jgi:hypothetical protein